jgi:hypothetical protein
MSDDSLAPNDGESLSKSRRPPNAYILYCLEKRAELRMIHPNLPNVEISRMLGVNWKCLDESDRRPYKERARSMQADFKQQHPDYKYDKARQKRQAHETLVQHNRQPVGALELAGLDPAVYLQFLQTIAMRQGKQNVTQVLPTAPPDTHVGLSADFQFPPDLFDPR